MNLRRYSDTDDSRTERRIFRLLTAAALALSIVLNVAPAAAGHLRVKTSDIDNGAVTTPKLGDDAVGRNKVKDGIIGHRKLDHRAVAARGYAWVHGQGDVDPDLAKNISADNVVVLQPGYYCFLDLPFEPTLAVATPTSGADHHIAVQNEGGLAAPCPARTQLVVYIQATDPDRHAGFNIVIF